MREPNSLEEALIEIERIKRVAAAALRVAEASMNMSMSVTRSARLQEAVDDGDEEKQWVGGTCETCQENADAGWIDIDEDFPSGDDEPPAHPNCVSGDTLVSAAGISRAFKRRFEGEVIVLRCAGMDEPRNAGR